VVGSESLQYEAECILLFDQVFTELGLKVDIRINNRKLLSALSHLVDAPEQLTAITTAIDKLDKIGLNGVNKIVESENLSEDQIRIIHQYLATEHLADMYRLFANKTEGLAGIKEIEEVYEYLENIPLNNQVTFDPTLARGLSYYT